CRDLFNKGLITLDDDDQRDGLEFAMEGIKSLNNVSQDKEVEAHAELSGGIASDGNVDPYYEARVGNTTGDVLERDLLPIVPRPYDIPYPYDEGSGSESPSYTKDDWEEIHEVNLGLQKKELYKDPKCAQQTQAIKRQSANLKQHNESIVHANEEDKKHKKYRSERDALVIEKEKIEEELVETKSQLEHRERQVEEIQGSIASFFQSDFTPLVRRFLKSGEFNLAFVSVLNTTISVGVERGLRMDCSDEEFRELS
ncbi:hypothetical protein Tco_0508462, partial [Tanacetum coccineum]